MFGYHKNRCCASNNNREHSTWLQVDSLPTHLGSHIIPFYSTPRLGSMVAPFSAGSSTFHWHEIPWTRNCSITVLAISKKCSVASASIVGPAPDRQIPRKPGWLLGVIDESVSVKLGTRGARYGWWNLSLIARKMRSASGGDWPRKLGSKAIRLELNT